MQNVIDCGTPKKTDLIQRTQNLRSLQEQHQNVSKRTRTSPPSHVQLPLWAETLRCLPNEIVRSALFNARNRNQLRAQLEDAEIAVIGDGRITYGGQELRQDDEIVWLQLIHMAKERPLGQTVEFTPYSFCQAVGWFPVNGRSYIRLRECLKRMQKTSLEIISRRLKEGVSLSMIPMFHWQDIETGRPLRLYKVRVAPELMELFGGVHYTHLEWSQRLALPVGIATWLHGYLASHEKPYSIKLETIKKGAGITIPSKHLRTKVTQALEALKRVGFLSSYRIDGDLVHVVRTARKNLAC